MNNWNKDELTFRCERLSIRLERLADNFRQLADLDRNNLDLEKVVYIIRESKAFLELTAIDLDIDSAAELAQMQRQLSRWHVHLTETLANQTGRSEISTLSIAWANRLQEMTAVLT